MDTEALQNHLDWHNPSWYRCSETTWDFLLIGSVVAWSYPSCKLNWNIFVLKVTFFPWDTISPNQQFSHYGDEKQAPIWVINHQSKRSYSHFQSIIPGAVYYCHGGNNSIFEAKSETYKMEAHLPRNVGLQLAYNWIFSRPFHCSIRWAPAADGLHGKTYETFGHEYITVLFFQWWVPGKEAALCRILLWQLRHL